MPITKMSVRLLKGIESPEQALKEEGNRLHPVELTGNPEDRQLWAGQIYAGDPGWFTFFNAEEIQKMRDMHIRGAGGAAILFVRVAHIAALAGVQTTTYRWMAVCFGTGYHALRQDKIEPNFGTIVALNKIGRDLIRSIDTKRPEDSTIQTRTQNSKKGDIFDFGIDADRIILHSITGSCDDEAFASTLTGSEGLSINCEVSYNTVVAKCQDIYDSYQLTDYEERAPWYGKILPVKDQNRVEELNIMLVTLLNDRDTPHNMHLTPPEIVDFQDIEKFRYAGPFVNRNTGEARDGFDDLDMQDFFSRLQAGTVVSMEVLEGTEVQISCGENGHFRKKWTVFRCITGEMAGDTDGVLYVLTNGEWYEIDQNFVRGVRADIAAIPEARLRLPPFDDSVHREDRAGKSCLSEGAYNRQVVEFDPTHYSLCDRQNIPFAGEKGPVEFCDLFHRDKKIIHVKMRGASAVLSHHFLQGHVSAEAFRNSAEFRAEIRTRKPGLQQHIPEVQPDCSEYEVVFAFIQHNQRYLPFFSQIALRAVYQMISNMNYRVSILWIDRNRVDTAVDEQEEEGLEAAAV